jgi:diguanylate cyclase (GGDEF)-like protein/PAS domain S-box-containing protein
VRFRGAFETTGHGMAIVAPDGRFLDVNEALTKIIGYSAAELRAGDFQEITHPDDLTADLAHVKRLLDGEARFYEMEKRYIHKDGRIIWAQLNVGLIRGTEGQPLYFVSQIHDISARKELEDRQKRIEAALTQAQRLAKLGYYRWSKTQQQLISCNDEYRRILGQSLDPEQADMRGVRPYLHPGDRERVDKSHKAAEVSGIGVQIEFRIIRPNGEVRYLRDRNESEPNPEGAPETWFGTVQDITEQRQTELALLEYQGRLDLTLHAAKAAYWEVDLRAGTHKLAENYYAILGYTLEESPRTRQGWLDLIHPADVHRTQTGQSLPPFDDGDHEYEFRIKAKNGTWRWLLSRFRVTAFDDFGHPTRLQGIDSDVTAMKEAELAVQVERNRARLYLDVAGAILVVLDTDARVVLLNRRGSEVLGIPEKDAIGRNWFDAYSPPEERESQRASYSAFLAGERGAGQDIEMTLVTVQGDIRLIAWHDTLLRNEEGRVVGGISSGEDITVRRQLETRLEELVTRDELTGAYNRRHFMAQAPVEIQRAVRYQRPLSFMFLDLDHFKSINDRFGHAMGDEVLKAFSRLCRGTFRPTDLFARYGGEEFVVMLPETALEQAVGAAQRLRTALRDFKISANPPIEGPTVSIGVGELLGAGESLDALLERIDKATYRAKALGRDRIEVSRVIGAV